MIIGIDASNIRSGGGLTHLVNLLRAANPREFGISSIVVWSSQATLNKIEGRAWLVKMGHPLLEKGLLYRTIWQRFYLSKVARKQDCSLLLVPGGSYAGNYHPVVVMSRNMLPFEPSEAAQFGKFSLMRLKMKLLRYSQSSSLKGADGVIFLSNYALSSITKQLGGLSCAYTIIPHGIERRFLQPPRTQRSLSACTNVQPFSVLYVSLSMPYKHQVEVAIAVSHLRSEKIPIRIRFVGASWGGYGHRLRKLINQLDPEGEYLLWTGFEKFEVLHELYRNADAFVFASSCENLPNILIEAMASGLPVACSNQGPMPEVLGDAGIYFDPEDPDSIANSLRQLANDTELRSKLADMAWQKANFYSWERCAKETFEFIVSVLNQPNCVSSKPGL